MNPDEIIKAAPELLKHGAELVGALKLTEVAKAMLGPATGEFAERVKDEIRLYRFGRQLELLKKAEKMVQDAGFTPKAVPIKLLFPLLEGASLEENEDLHTMWAALLANASSPYNADKVRPGFTSILRELAPDEAALLNWAYENKIRFHTVSFGFPDGEFGAFLALGLPGFTSGNTSPSGPSTKRFYMCLDALVSAQLLIHATRGRLLVSFRGCEFVEACQPPKPKQS